MTGKKIFQPPYCETEHNLHNLEIQCKRTREEGAIESGK